MPQNRTQQLTPSLSASEWAGFADSVDAFRNGRGERAAIAAASSAGSDGSPRWTHPIPSSGTCGRSAGEHPGVSLLAPVAHPVADPHVWPGAEAVERDRLIGH